jgi:uncharacterized repeat protein (TIGR03803 family)
MRTKRSLFDSRPRVTKTFSFPLIPIMGLLMIAFVLPGNASEFDHERLIYSLTDNYLGPRDKLLYVGGQFYATAPGGGHVTYSCPNGCGAVFELSLIPGGGTYHSLYEFLGGENDGWAPVGNIVMDSAGNIYGTTTHGGLGAGCLGGCGTVFKLTPGSNGHYTESIIHFFSFPEGTEPTAGLTFDSSGNLYGTTSSGGNGYGSVFELTANSDGSWSANVLYRFGEPPDGEIPRAEVTLDAAGNIYGTTTQGGSSSDGTVFQLVQNSGGGWTENVLYEFNSAAGCTPEAPILIGRAGNLYGTAAGCGTYAAGVVYELAPGTGGSWSESTVHSFGYGIDGANPQSPLTADGKGNLWGTTLFGGGTNGGTVYELKPNPDGGWSEAVVYNVQLWGNCFFPPVCDQPTTIFSTLTFGSDGTAYGTASGGGVNDQGAIYEILQ